MLLTLTHEALKIKAAKRHKITKPFNAIHTNHHHLKPHPLAMSRWPIKSNWRNWSKCAGRKIWYRGNGSTTMMRWMTPPVHFDGKAWQRRGGPVPVRETWSRPELFLRPAPGRRMPTAHHLLERPMGVQRILSFIYFVSIGWQCLQLAARSPSRTLTELRYKNIAI